MKTVQDWGFISKEQGLVKPKLQDNKIFHALTTAYENNQQQEIYGATENIVRREKELCEMALADLKRLAGGKGDPDGTLKLVLDHYQSRLHMAKEKEDKINLLSEDSRKMMEEYKKRTQELADVKRNLMESQTKLRELAKNTEKLLKKEEELRFIESNLRTELDRNKRDIINGLYEIVTDIAEQPPEAAVPAPKAEAVRPAPPETAAIAPEKNAADPDAARSFTEGLFRKPAIAPAQTSSPAPVSEHLTAAPLAPAAPIAAEQPIFGKPFPLPEESVWTRDRNPTQVAVPQSAPAASAPAPAPHRESALMDKAARLKMFEPGKSLCNKSMVKTQEGEVISEYFYSPLHPKEGRHYIFNSLFAVWSLLSLKTRDEEAFQERLETVFTDLLSRLEHSQNIHLETFLGEEINKSVLATMLAAPRDARPGLFDTVSQRLLSRIESVGPSRAGLIDNQFRQLPKPDFPPKAGLTA